MYIPCYVAILYSYLLILRYVFKLNVLFPGDDLVNKLGIEQDTQGGGGRGVVIGIGQPIQDSLTDHQF